MLKVYWVIDDPADEERYLLVDVNTPHAEAMTQLHLPNRGQG